MSALKIWTSEEILAERAADAASGKLAHSGNSWGFSARYGCSCYNCRDALDPTGEEDAAARNKPEPEPEPELEPSSQASTGTLVAEEVPDVTPAEILDQRQAARARGGIAHTANVSGDFMAWTSCTCYACRDYLDPTGEEDANRARGPVGLMRAATGAY